MRAKVVLSASALALLILVPAIYFHFAPSSPPPDQTTPAPETPVAQAAPVAPTPHKPGWMKPHPEDAVPTPDGAADSSGTEEDSSAKRQGELAELGMSDDPSDLKIILTELNNKDTDIRKAALSAAVQFGSQDAIPTLQYEVGITEDPEEKVELLNAIKYLQLPTFQQFQASLAAGAPPQQSSDQAPPTN